MRTVSANTSAEIAKTVTNPVVLIEVLFSPSPLRLSSRGLVTAFSNIYVERNFNISGVTPLNASAVIENQDLSISTLFLGELESIACNIYKYYGTTSVPATADIETIFSGYVDEVNSASLSEVSFSAIANSESTSKHPRYRINDADFNHLPAPGMTFFWGGEKITLDISYG